MKGRRVIAATSATLGLLTAACGKSESQQAEDRYNMAISAITGGNLFAEVPDFREDELLAEKCRRGREVQEAYLREGNSERHAWWKLITDIACQRAQLRRANRLGI